MNLKRLRELADKYIDEECSINGNVIDNSRAATVKDFFKFVKAKEKERRSNDFVSDPSPMIGINPFKSVDNHTPYLITISDGTGFEDASFLNVPDSASTKRIIRFNELLNYRMGGYE